MNSQENISGKKTLVNIIKFKYIRSPIFEPNKTFQDLEDWSLTTNSLGEYGLKPLRVSRYEPNTFLTQEDSLIQIPDNELVIEINNSRVKPTNRIQNLIFLDFNNYLLTPHKEVFAYLTKLDNQDQTPILTISHIGPNPQERGLYQIFSNHQILNKDDN